MTSTTPYILTDMHGQNYFEGRHFTKDEAVRLAGEMSAAERPQGVWLCALQGNTAIEDIELYAPEGTTP